MISRMSKRKAVDWLLENEDDQAAKYELRMRYYEDHVERMEKARSLYTAQLIADGMLEPTPGVLEAEFYVKPEGLKRVFNTEKTFSEKQMEIAMRSLDAKPEPLESWL